MAGDYGVNARKPWTKKKQSELDEMRGYWYECGRNLSKTAKRYKLCARTVSDYCRKQKWIEWADLVETKAADVAAMSVARRRAKQLVVCDAQLEKIRKALDARGKLPFRPSPTELRALVQATELLTGGPTDRNEVVNLTPEQLAEANRKMIEDLRQATKSRDEDVPDDQPPPAPEPAGE